MKTDKWFFFLWSHVLGSLVCAGKSSHGIWLSFFFPLSVVFCQIVFDVIIFSMFSLILLFLIFTVILLSLIFGLTLLFVTFI